MDIDGLGYTPDSPYLIESGKRVGKCLELLMFKDYPFLVWFKNERNKECKDPNRMNKMHKHLIWLLAQGNTRKSSVVCPQCGRNPITHFSVIRGKFGISISANHICCDNQNCKEKLIGMAGGKMPEILPLKFWVLDYFSYRSDQRAIANLFRKLFGLEERLTREKAFEFFKR